jgi:hypothetical protein
MLDAAVGNSTPDVMSHNPETIPRLQGSAPGRAP